MTAIIEVRGLRKEFTITRRAGRLRRTRRSKRLDEPAR